MEEIVIGLFTGRGQTEVMVWHHVNAILAEPQFSKLGTFRICSTSSPEVDWLIDHLPQCSSCGILFKDVLFGKWPLTTQNMSSLIVPSFCDIHSTKTHHVQLDFGLYALGRHSSLFLVFSFERRCVHTRTKT